MRRTLRVTAFASLAAGGTVAVGWWTVPMLAAAWVRALPFDRRPVRTTVIGASLGWIVLLAMDTYYAPVAALDSCMSAVFGLPKWGFLAVTILYSALLAGAAALLVKPAAPR